MYTSQCSLCSDEPRLLTYFLVLSFSVGLLLTQEYVKAFGFISRHPEVTYNLFEFGITSAIGQVNMTVCLVM